jgi:uncharacterized phage-associated protein
MDKKPTESKVFLVADYFIKKNEEDKKGLGALKLQKLLYYAQAWNLVINDGKLFDQEFQAWVHGPAIPEVWQAFREFDFNVDHPEFLEKEFNQFSDKEKEVLDMVWHVYGKFDGKYLEMLTHQEEPWQKARNELGTDTASQNVISDESMKSYYEQRLEEATRAGETNNSEN